MNKWNLREAEIRSAKCVPKPDAIDCTKKRLTRTEQHQVFIKTLEEIQKKKYS